MEYPHHHKKVRVAKTGFRRLASFRGHCLRFVEGQKVKSNKIFRRNYRPVKICGMSGSRVRLIHMHDVTLHALYKTFSSRNLYFRSGSSLELRCAILLRQRNPQRGGGRGPPWCQGIITEGWHYHLPLIGTETKACYTRSDCC